MMDIISPTSVPAYKSFWNKFDKKLPILKKLDLPLKNIEKVLSKVTIEQLLNVHRSSLKQKIEDLEAAALHTNTLLNILKMEGALNWEQLIPLIKREKKKEWDHFFNEKEQAILFTRLPKLEDDERQINKWINLMRRIEICLEKKESPSSEEGQIIAADVLVLTDETFGGDRALQEKFWNVRRSAEASEALNLYPIREEAIDLFENK